MFKGKARAYTNIALIKYWGKKNEELILPMNNSLSLTLDAFYTETEVIFSDSYMVDEFYLDGTLQDEKATKKVSQFLDLFRKEAGLSLKASVISQNFVPTAAGLASSASGLAALAGACNTALKLGLDDLSLSRFARRGSGSACRSIFGGFVEWEKGHDDLSSYAKPVPSDSFEDDLAMVFVLINDQKKEVSSRNGMRRTVETSSFYQGWLDSVEGDLYQLKQSIKTKDFQLLGETMERNGLKMHGTTLAAQPPFTYWSPDSLKAMDAVRQLRKQGIPCYFTMDAGPNVKVLVENSHLSEVQETFTKLFSKEQVITAHAGPGIAIIE
ncbi:TPA: diphosphomevalonate decarboxylase [Enterococcus faecium]|uniref:diphosphomevalonate decarboxylase n=1 Tax=Enterococcus TaxID=1350 RepID=UPI0002A3F9EB|nr:MULTISPECIES: diphosphomevalonate decarboxylase [Enterococcus]EGP5569357.1 diphosphomevalonate decarboxylase [Enterococcus faecium]ELA67396.1 diphosphomevalonate decarboxylase [Enterococcus faecium EnGen0008]ELA84732.1 diphosphomevalonate decarboxylase [Enterococcus faecium EnGen0021]EME7178155.1 diphosphomevalonate decarboxylase [Enterococcus faecium]EME7189574.1 diphosphomevalonate decarboxylase [Enterococcus faecium]